MGWQPECIGVMKLYLHEHPRQIQVVSESQLGSQEVQRVASKCPEGSSNPPSWEAEEYEGQYSSLLFVFVSLSLFHMLTEVLTLRKNKETYIGIKKCYSLIIHYIGCYTTLSSANSWYFLALPTVDKD